MAVMFMPRAIDWLVIARFHPILARLVHGRPAGHHRLLGERYLLMETDTSTSTGLQNEAWFLAEIEKPHVNLQDLIDYLESLRASGKQDEAEGRAELLQDMLAEKKKADDALRILELRTSWVTGKNGVAALWEQEAQDILGSSWEQKALIEQSKSERIISARESVRRLRLLRSLKDGSLCYDKTWGMGSVTKVDFFNKKVEIDFERKLGHKLSLSYAAESIQIIDENHILVWKHRKLLDLRKLADENPAEVVRLAIRSFGSISTAQLQSLMQNGIITEADWKKFWDGARKALKSDPLVQLPANRGEAIRFLAHATAREDNWFADLARERDIIKVVAKLEELADRKQKPPIGETERRILMDRISFVVKGATIKQLGLKARTLMVTKQLGLDSQCEWMPAERQALLRGDTLVSTMRQLLARHVQPFLRFIGEGEEERTTNLVIAILPRLDLIPFSESLEYMLAKGQAEAVAAVFKSALDMRKASIEQLSWLARNIDYLKSWSLGSSVPWANMMVDGLEEELNGEKLKAQNQLRERFNKQDWLRQLLVDFDEHQRRKFIMRIKESAGWSTLDRQPVLAHIVKMYPELEAVLAAKKEKADANASRMLTSIRSYSERQRQLQHLIGIEIPQIAKDIGIARSYGDLRENFEFKAAKEAQTVAMRKRDELDDMLRRVTPSDFKGFPADVAGIATTVKLRYADGREEQYHILGEWDGDTNLGIISCSSRMAIALAGKKAGDSVVVPTEQGEVQCLLLSVDALPDDIRAWVRADGIAV